MVRSVLYLQPRGNAHAALADFYRRYDILATAVAAVGCRSTELQIPLDGEGPALVTALWDDEAHYQRWIDHELRGNGGDELVDLIDHDADGVGPGRIYTVAVAASGPDAVPVGVDDVDSTGNAQEA
jgi:heme-degrading monooxygenase HmoA